MNLDREVLISALRKISEHATQRARWNYDSIECAKLQAKYELCDELIELLELPGGTL